MYIPCILAYRTEVSVIFTGAGKSYLTHLNPTTRGPLVLYHSPEGWGYAELEPTWKYKSNQCSISCQPYRSIRNKFDPVIKMVKVNPGSSIEKSPRHSTTWYKFWQHFKAYYHSHHFVPIPERSLLPHYFIWYFVLFHTCTRDVQELRRKVL